MSSPDTPDAVVSVPEIFAYWLQGGWVDVGLPGAGVTAVISDLGVLEPDAETCELTLTSVYPGVAAAEARAATGWSLHVADELRTNEPPTVGELAALRALKTRQLAG